MIIINLIGGVGNQLFQYATAKAIAINCGFDLKIDISDFENYHTENYELYNFNIKEKFATMCEIETLLKHRKVFKKYYYKEKKSKFMPQILKLKNSAYLEGYFQTEKYFYNIKDIIKKEFTFKNNDFLINKDVLNEIQNENSVSINLRGNDYINDKEIAKYFNVCTKKYYDNAISYINKKMENPKFYIFSDDMNYAKEFFKSKKDFKIIETANWQEDFYFMQNCKSNIIANSSFSWWCAWLNNNPEKIVVAPKKWNNNPNMAQKNIVPNDWIKINV